MNNIIERVWKRDSMVNIEDLRGSAFQNEKAGHTFIISGIEGDGETVSLSGTVAGSFLRPDDTTVAIVGSATDGKVYVTLPENCYDVPGRFGFVIFLTENSQKTAIYAAIGAVARTSSSTAAPGTTADVVTLVNAIATAVATIPASYTDLMADIAPTYSSSALYAVGQYAWYNGDLKRCIVPITTAETYTAAHWTSAVIGQDITDLKSAVINDEVEISHTYIRYNRSISATGGISSEISNYACTATFIPVKAGSVVKSGSLQVKISKYTAPVAASFTEQSSYVTTDYTIETAGFIRLTFRKNNSASVAVTEQDILNNVHIIENGTRHSRLDVMHNLIKPETVDMYRGMSPSSGSGNSSSHFALTKHIDIDNDKIYYLDITSKGTKAFDVYVFAYDANGDFVNTGYNNTAGTEVWYMKLSFSASASNEKRLFLFANAIKDIQIMYDFTDTDSIEFGTFVPAVEKNNQLIKDMGAELEELAKGCVITGKSNQTYVEEIIAVAQSYYNQKDGQGRYHMTYDAQNTVLSAEYNGKGGIDCSTYIGLVLRGIPFEDTEYKTAHRDGEAVDPEGDDEDDDGQYDYSYDANPEYDWSVNPFNYEISAGPYSDAKWRVRSAAQLADFLVRMGRMVWKDDHLANLLPGDIVFFAKKYSSGKWVQPARYLHISHVAIITDKTVAPFGANWDTAQYPYAHTMYHVKGNEPDTDACDHRILEDDTYTGATENGTDTLVLICRPDLGHITPQAT